MFFKSMSRPMFALWALALACLLLSVLVVSQPLRITTVNLEEDPTNQQYLVTLSRKVKAEELRIAISPAIGFEYTIRDTSLAIRFTEPFSYNTTYTITLQANNASVTSQFKTASPKFYYFTRSETTDDTLYQGVIENNPDKPVFSHPAIVTYAVAKDSIIVAVTENEATVLYRVQGKNKQKITLPDSYSFRAIDGSTTDDTYAITLTNEDLAITGWVYSAATDSWTQVVAAIGDSLLASTLQFAPDGKSVYYLDQNRSLLLDDPTDNRSPSNLGVFDAALRFLPNQRGIFAARGTSFVTIGTSGEVIPAPEALQLSFSPLQLQKPNTFVTITQRLNTQEQLSQYLLRFDGETVTQLNEASIADRLFLKLSSSPNDQYLVTEEATSPVRFDTVPLNSKPLLGVTYIRDAKTGNVVRSIEGFDVVWR